MSRKTPVLLRRGPFTGRINALTNYRRINGGKIIEVEGDGKHDVSSDFYALVLEELFPKHSEAPLITSSLDGAAKGMELNKRERASLNRLRNRLVKFIEIDNERIDRERAA